MRWLHRRKIDASDMQIVEITGAMLSSPTIVVRGVVVQPPTFVKGTVAVVKNDTERTCTCSHWWQDHNDDDSCALCGCDWFQQEGCQ